MPTVEWGRLEEEKPFLIIESWYSYRFYFSFIWIKGTTLCATTTRLSQYLYFFHGLGSFSGSSWDTQSALNALCVLRAHLARTHRVRRSLFIAGQAAG